MVAFYLSHQEAEDILGAFDVIQSGVDGEHDMLTILVVEGMHDDLLRIPEVNVDSAEVSCRKSSVLQDSDSTFICASDDVVGVGFQLREVLLCSSEPGCVFSHGSCPEGLNLLWLNGEMRSWDCTILGRNQLQNVAVVVHEVELAMNLIGHFEGCQLHVEELSIAPKGLTPGMDLDFPITTIAVDDHVVPSEELRCIMGESLLSLDGDGLRGGVEGGHFRRCAPWIGGMMEELGLLIHFF